MPVTQLPEFYNVVNGGRAPAKSTFDVFNPATGEVVAACPSASTDQANEAVAAAKEAFKLWRKVPLTERAAYLMKAADVMDANIPELARLLTLEQGKPLAAATFEASVCSLHLRHLAESKIPREIVKDTDDERIEVVYQPLGVVVGITPWNFPLVICILKLASPIIFGNTVVVKPSPFTPLSSLRAADLLKDVFPPGVFNVLAGGNDLGATLVAHPDVAAVTFTGSVATGKAIAASCTKMCKRFTLELGGNDAAIVREDCDMDKAAQGIFNGAFGNSGQICCAIKRLYVHESKYDEVCTRLAELAQKAKVGNGLDEGVEFGPINNKMQYDRVKELLSDAIANGAKVLSGGLPDDGQPGYMFPLTIVTGVEEGVRLVDEEQFGPVLPIMKYTSEDEVVARANNTRFGLGASVWGADTEKAVQLAQELQAGSAWINQHATLLPTAPFGGFKESGMGREFGDFTARSFLEPQSVMIKKL